MVSFLFCEPNARIWPCSFIYLVLQGSALAAKGSKSASLQHQKLLRTAEGSEDSEKVI